MFDHDPELPAGFQDADFQTRALQDSARQADAARRRGQCPHLSIQGPPGPASAPRLDWCCHDCGKRFATERDLNADRPADFQTPEPGF